MGRELRALAADESVHAIVLDMDSPGGLVEGVTEFATEVRRAQERKPVVAVANYLMASAGYWIGASATEVVAAPSAKVGSIGVFSIHDDFSRAREADGVTRTVISAGKFKAAPSEPLTDEARAATQALVDDAFNQFVNDVAAGRGVSVAAVRNGFGEGRTLSAGPAMAAGMIDQIATLDETIARVAAQPPLRRRTAAAARRSRQVARALALGSREPPPTRAQSARARRLRAAQRAVCGIGT